MRFITRVQEIAVFSNKYGTLFNDIVVNSAGEEGNYLRWLWSHKGVVTIPYRDGLLALVKMFRYPIQDFSLEFPRGAIENDETEIIAAIRELREESGLSCTQAHKIGEVYPDSGLLAQSISIVVANISGQHSIDEEPMEAIDSVEWFTPREVNNLIDNGSIKCGITISAFTLFKLKIKNLKSL
jgi:ADP-ribose pyrophosphatase